MNKIEKLFRRISAEDKLKILEVINKLITNNLDGLDIKKLTGTNSFRLRKGNYRIIFHRGAETKNVIIDSIKIRNEGTYK